MPPAIAIAAPVTSAPLASRSSTTQSWNLPISIRSPDSG
jgi:hypothetical protein